MKAWLKVAIASIVSAFGALFAVGCLLAAYFEMDPSGFWRPSEYPEPRLIYLLGLAFGFFASVGVPAFLWRLFFPSMRWVWLVALVIGVIGAGAIIGIKIL